MLSLICCFFLGLVFGYAYFGSLWCSVRGLVSRPPTPTRRLDAHSLLRSGFLVLTLSLASISGALALLPMLCGCFVARNLLIWNIREGGKPC